jgi:hypothetical protein
MKKRTARLGNYDTASHGWTMSGCVLSDAEQKTNYVERTGGDGSWDLSTVLTGGIPRYKNRTLTLTLENSQGDRAARERTVSEMVNQLDGLVWHIVLPDYPDHYLEGRVHIKVNYSDLAHASVTVTADCQPWLFKTMERIVVLNAPITNNNELATFYLLNDGRKVVTPKLEVKGIARLKFNGVSEEFAEGTYNYWSVFQLVPGQNKLEYTGSYNGTDSLTITYREAVLR